MTVKNNSLSDRLNNFKNKIPLDENKNNSLQEKPSVMNVFNSIISLLVLFTRSFVYGYAIKLIFNTEWKFFGYLCVGFALSFILHFLYDTIKK